MKSMTGYGRAEVRTEELTVSVEITSVNRKQSDIVVNLPRDYAALELEARKVVAARISRGRVQVSLRVESAAEQAPSLVDTELAGKYAAALRQLGTDLNLAGELTLGDLLRAPGIFSTADAAVDASERWPLFQQAIEAGLQALESSREREGEHLAQDLTKRLGQLRMLLGEIAAAVPQVVKNAREALHKRLADAGLELPLDDERLLKEIALFADRCDITEEITRLGGHLDEFSRMMAAKEAQGRAMDFLTQEMNRELNTMGAKANNAGIAHFVVAGKTEVERIREQVQNIE
jgi:uncharacterized protein (TIGR00255 family)